MECKCNQCGYVWLARVKNPKACPECKRRDWHEPKKTKRELKVQSEA